MQRAHSSARGVELLLPRLVVSLALVVATPWALALGDSQRRMLRRHAHEREVAQDAVRLRRELAPAEQAERPVFGRANRAGLLKHTRLRTLVLLALYAH